MLMLTDKEKIYFIYDGKGLAEFKNCNFQHFPQVFSVISV